MFGEEAEPNSCMLHTNE